MLPSLAEVCCWFYLPCYAVDVFIIEDKLELMLLSQIQYRMCSCTFPGGWTRKASHGSYRLCETLLHLPQVPEPDGERWPISGRCLQPVRVSARWERYGAQGRAHRPARLPSQRQCRPKPVFASAGSGLLHTGMDCSSSGYLIFNGVTGLMFVCVTAPLSSNAAAP